MYSDGTELSLRSPTNLYGGAPEQGFDEPTMLSSRGEHMYDQPSASSSDYMEYTAVPPQRPVNTAYFDVSPTPGDVESRI